MTTTAGRCFFCKSEANLTKEHIIPQSLGGVLTERLLCATCNSQLGKGIDAAIARQFGKYATHLQLKRARGENQPVEVVDDLSGIMFQFKDGVLTRKDPLVEVKKSESGSDIQSIRVIARTPKELTRTIDALAKRYGLNPSAFDVDNIQHTAPSSTNDLDFKNRDVLRGIAKIAYMYACTKLVPSWLFSTCFDQVREYIDGNIDQPLASPNFVHTEFMQDESRPLHRVHIALNRLEGLIIGYVMLFGCFRYTVLLAKGFSCNIEWPSIGYTFDPIRQIEVEKDKLFLAPKLTIDQVLKPADSVQRIEKSLQKGLDIIVAHSEGLDEATVWAER